MRVQYSHREKRWHTRERDVNAIIVEDRKREGGFVHIDYLRQASAPVDDNCYKKVAGVRIPKIFNDENFRSAVNYVPRDGDLFIVTYPKCGTSWMQYIVCSILTRGDPPSNVVDLNAMAPFIDVCGTEITEKHERTGPVVTHIPLTVLRPSERAKYIYVARNRYDCAVSCYHFMKRFIPKTTGDISFESFLPKFTRGMVRHIQVARHNHRGTSTSKTRLGWHAPRVRTSNNEEEEDSRICATRLLELDDHSF
ncbi:hypothetical protein HPB51_007659 [Rhipicephalus microplus]|uniref:Sulfotransferase domain-containing protein n=1 Tax=Rhipicephalus microplus TaxID=6941 RepID=A0A9J6E0V4_RHIMP|nr:hypothetical protein HPB51_007659 [Rhipicephalus microplus]